MANTKYMKARPLTLDQQGYFLTLAFPGFRRVPARSELRCTGTLQPSATSDAYLVEIKYKIPVRPHVRILEPQLKLAQGHKKLPHVFAGNDLCLYSNGEWRPDLRISEYIVPWVSFWLYFYEVWLLTGLWLGGGHEPTTEK
jgi:hypothetical protein